ncbi:hypothetical protein M405DRAFT_829713 [Rhizopogon salebrosus TDB-379]|nr:hypothetical protein M405DRAFT_829713 [Rhizopogon salebrosus TDB-379]
MNEALGEAKIQTPGIRASRQTVSYTIDGDATRRGLAQLAQWRFCQKRVSVITTQ